MRRFLLIFVGIVTALAMASAIFRQHLLQRSLAHNDEARLIAGIRGSVAWISYLTGIYGKRMLNVSAKLGNGERVQYQVEIDLGGRAVGRKRIYLSKDVNLIENGRSVIVHQGGKFISVDDLLNVIKAET